MSVILDAALCVVTAVLATIFWNDPHAQFACGMNLAVSIWCAVDVIKGAVRA